MDKAKRRAYSEDQAKAEIRSVFPDLDRALRDVGLGPPGPERRRRP